MLLCKYFNKVPLQLPSYRNVHQAPKDQLWSSDPYSYERPQLQADDLDGQQFVPRQSRMDQAMGRAAVPTVPWHPGAQLNGPGQSGVETDNLLHPPKPQSSAASHSTVVSDYGDAEHLAENRSNIESRVSTDEIIVHSGARFSNASNLPILHESDISTQRDQTPVEGLSKNNLEDQSTEETNLGQSIRASLQPSVNGREEREFLPIDALEKTITRASVRRELCGVVPLGDLEDFTTQIWEVTLAPLSKSPNKKTTRRKIFAILALMQKIGEIVGFIKEKIYDIDLPFILSDGSRPGLRQLVRKGNDGKLHIIQPFLSAQWSTHELEFFNNAQWLFLAPYFRLSTKEKPNIKHYILENRSTLPFIENNEEKREGGFSDVWRVKIHPAHHNYCEDMATGNENPNFALKRLRHNSSEAFKTEVENLKRFSAKDHLHLIKLLVTFSWREQYYLVFPWADGNLLDFWKLNPKPSNPLIGHQFALWFSKQCLGIAEGLKMIHTSDTPLTGDLSEASTRQIHGRHGDLKPENILWFKSYQDTDPSCFMGVLKISDFGLTRFHRSMSKSHVDARGLGMSPTYRAPEYDISKQVSQSYDIWTLGCVLLEFVTWYLLGWSEVDIFSKERARDDNIEFKENREDAFFNYVKPVDDHGRIGARAKESVADEFTKLYKHEDCFDFMLDLLLFIEEKLLRMGPKKRADCEEIVQWFTNFHAKCSIEPEYCTESRKEPPDRTKSDLSVLYAFEYSPEMDKRLKRYSGSFVEYTGRRQSDASSSSPKPPAQILATDSSRNSITTRKVQPESQVRAAGKMDSITEPQTPSPIVSDTLAAADDNDYNRSRTQSPSRKVHFEQKKKSEKPETAQYNEEMETVQDRLGETAIEKSRNVSQEDLIPTRAGSLELQGISGPENPSPMGLGLSMQPIPEFSATVFQGSPTAPKTIGNDLEETGDIDNHLKDGNEPSDPPTKGLYPLQRLGVVGHDSDSHTGGEEANGSALCTSHEQHEPGTRHTTENEKLGGRGNGSQKKVSGQKNGLKHRFKRCKGFFSSRFLCFKSNK